MDKIPKLYYSISEVAELFGVSNSLIRYWEQEFPSLKPKKNRKGDRRFMKKDIELLRIIYHLVKEKGYTLEGAKKTLKEEKTRIKQKLAVIDKMKSIRGFLVEMKQQLDE